MGEVCSVVDVSQFDPGRSLDRCGFFGVALLKYAGSPGQAPHGSPADCDSWASLMYTKYAGQDTIWDTNGMTVSTLYSVIGEAGLHYQAIGAQETGFHPERLTSQYIRAWLKQGYPVIISVAEDDVYDCDLGAKPYNWDTSGYYHIILATGVAPDSNLFVHDTASIGPYGVRRGPRRYDAVRLETGLTSATAVVMPWLAQPQPDFDPTQASTLQEGDFPMGVPAGWNDDGMTLTNPINSFVVRTGFRTFVLTHSWDPTNVPLENEHAQNPMEISNPSIVPGTQQAFRLCVLEWTPNKNVVFAMWVGEELLKLRALTSSLQTKLNTLQMQLTPGIPTGWRDDGTTLTNPVNTFSVHTGFRSYILTHLWDPTNVPLENEHGQNPMDVNDPTIIAGTQQTFQQCILEWTSDKNVVFIMPIGQELLKLRALLLANQQKSAA